MRKLRILALMHGELVPPDDVSGYDLAEVDWKTEYDVSANLRLIGHEVECLGVGEDLGVVRKAIDEWQPHIAFNLLEDFHDVAVFDQNVVSYLELLRLSYTGCNPRGLMLARDKGLSKTLLGSHRIPVPDFFVVRVGRRPRRPKRMDFPLIVKSLTKEASQGISHASSTWACSATSDCRFCPYGSCLSRKCRTGSGKSRPTGSSGTGLTS
jgi:D-alanine-D-alanine ligase